MSLFSFPRIHVSGSHVTNVGTGNNDSASPGEELTVTSDTEKVQPISDAAGDEEFRRWMMSKDEMGLLRAQWNYFGDMGFRFVDVRVTSTEPDHHTLLTEPEEDGLIGARVSLNHAFMCDANPEGFDSTQIFAESLQLTSRQALRDGMFVSRKPSRATTRSLNWYRNVSYHGPFGLPPHGVNGELSSGGAGGASATFEHRIEVRPEDLEIPIGSGKEFGFHRLLPLGTSPVLKELVRTLKRNGWGLIFRYNLYLCSPLLSDTELARRFAAGERIANPGYGRLVGTIAPLLHGEERRPTLGRYLKPCAPFTNPYRRDRPYFLAPVIASLHAPQDRLSLDIANTFPEDGEAGEKFNLGMVRVGIRKATEPATDPRLNEAEILDLGTIPNTRWDYLDRGGMADLDLSSLPPEVRDLLDSPDQELVIRTDHGVLLSESEYMIAADSSCNYLDDLAPGESWDDEAVRTRLMAEPSQALRGEVTIHARRRGHIPFGATDLVVEQWRLTPTGEPNQYGLYKFPKLLGTEQCVLEYGVGKLRLRPLNGPGLRRFRFVPSGTWPNPITPRSLAELAFKEFFVEVRVLPYVDFSQLATEAITFSLIYKEVFRYYHLILPAMSLRLDMSDASVWETPTAAQYTLRVLDPRLWDHYDYMPRTRDLCKGRRDLLIRFFRRVLERHGLTYDPSGPALLINGSGSGSDQRTVRADGGGG